LADFIQYIPRQVVTRVPKDAQSPWFSRQQPNDAGFYVPEFHVVPGQPSSLTGQVCAGDTIWVIGQLQAPRGTSPRSALPVALDACIDVARVKDFGTRGREFDPAPSSRWFRLADATPLMAQLESITAAGPPTSLSVAPGEKVGRRFQTLRKLRDAGPLKAWMHWLQTAPYDFVSYRQMDGTRAAFDLVGRLVQQGRVVFWDRWGLPRRLAERRERVSEPRLDTYLMNLIDQADQVLGVESPMYAVTSSYAYKEASHAKARGVYRAVRVDG
jgi:hypothetical protein